MTLGSQGWVTILDGLYQLKQPKRTTRLISKIKAGILHLDIAKGVIQK